MDETSDIPVLESQLLLLLKYTYRSYKGEGPWEQKLLPSVTYFWNNSLTLNLRGLSTCNICFCCPTKTMVKGNLMAPFCFCFLTTLLGQAGQGAWLNEILRDTCGCSATRESHNSMRAVHTSQWTPLLRDCSEHVRSMRVSETGEQNDLTLK